MRYRDMKTVRGVTLRQDPRREPCFTVVQGPEDLHEYAPGTPLSRREGLHRHVNTELQSLEIAAQTLAEFPEAPWDLRLHLARQCWDESRHAALVLRQLVRIGGFKGEFPVINYDYGVACAIDSLPGRLMVQNRTVEAGEMDVLKHLARSWREFGDAETADVMEGILADEIQHVRFANQWLKRQARETPRILLDAATGVSFVRAVTEAFRPKPGQRNAVDVEITAIERSEVSLNVADRRLAEFSEEELASLGGGPEPAIGARPVAQPPPAPGAP